ncbi:MAG: TetR/AcrR family transcriptional regulator [Calditrichaeota bacterium]|nr:TetR/AcrR family transcriptional regulator [Calditrichota bacterium]MCB0267731.1 TetR/AcrR family transcriptional regulator [Calditrichota bacterium]MCB0285009.1 TetR/AcrR family transcriptional regulator [Calditrichota bacterium]
MSVKTNEDVDSKKQQILKAAQRCFSRYGFSKTTLDDIATGVGIKKASLYYYYENKEAIFRDVIDTETKGLISELRRSVAQASSSTEKLFSFAKTQLEYFRNYVNLHDLSVQVVLEFKPLINKLYKNLREQQIEILEEVIEGGIKDGEFNKCEALRAADSILTILEAMKFKEFQVTTVQYASDIDYSKVEEEVNYILNMLLEGMKR